MARILETKPSPHTLIREFACVGCRSIHRLPGGAARISYNRDVNRPTIRPDLWYKVGPFKEGHPFAGQTFTCHFRITGGKILYFTDSTHPLAGKTVDLPDFDEIPAGEQAEEAIEAQAVPEPTE